PRRGGRRSALPRPQRGARLRCKLVPLLGRQALILLPLAPHLVLLVRRQRLQRLVTLARGVTLVGRQVRPLAHLALDALLLLGRKRRVALGKAEPPRLALRIAGGSGRRA